MECVYPKGLQTQAKNIFNLHKGILLSPVSTKSPPFIFQYILSHISGKVNQNGRIIFKIVIYFFEKMIYNKKNTF